MPPLWIKVSGRIEVIEELGDGRSKGAILETKADLACCLETYERLALWPRRTVTDRRVDEVDFRSRIGEFDACSVECLFHP